jgi:hypothetical protein
MIPNRLLQKAKLKGTTEEFEDYVRKCPSCLIPVFTEHVNGEGRCEFAHVRKVSAGAGAGIKPPYCGVPLTRLQHQNQSDYGYSYYMPFEMFFKKAIEYLQRWVNGLPPPEPIDTLDIEITHHNIATAFSELIRDKNQNGIYRLQYKKIKNTRSYQQQKGQFAMIQQGALQIKQDPLKFEALFQWFVKQMYIKIHNANLAKLLHEMFKMLYGIKTTNSLTKNIENNDVSKKPQEEYYHDIKHDFQKFGVYVDMPSKESKK